MKSFLVLWDIDHTLIENNGVNKKIYSRAFELLTGRTAEYLARTEGRTEPAIMRNMLLEHGIDPTAVPLARIAEALESATSSHFDELQKLGNELPGSREALAFFRDSAHAVQSVLTGNMKVNAMAKLSAFTLEGLIDFEVGGYGSDDDIRDNLVAISQRRANEKYAINFDKTNTVLLGDTSRDVQAGLCGGAHVVAVASGSESAGELRAAGATKILPNLRDTAAVADAVMSLLE